MPAPPPSKRWPDYGRNRVDVARQRYIENVGHEPTDPPEEYVRQWTYIGRTEADQELLLDLLQTEAEETIAEQETLF